MTTQAIDELWLVRIEFLRVQSFLFAVPRLSAMVGANVLLGETLRRELAKLRCAKRYRVPSSVLEKVCQLDVGEWTAKDPLPATGAIDGYPSDGDNPAALAALGILARDGGHFRAAFASESDGKAYASEAQSYLTRKLPGLRFEIDVENAGEKTARPSGTEARERYLIDLPQLQVCEETGAGPACDIDGTGDEARYISEAVQVRAKAYDDFRDRRSRDIIGLLGSELHPGPWEDPQDFKEIAGRKKCEKGVQILEWDDPQDFEQIAGGKGRYLAIIHADGNRVGDRYKEYVGGKDDALERQVAGERFFHSMRATVRRAVVDSLRKTFKETKSEFRPYQVLMLGGDDLLLVCRAERALWFLVNYAEELKELKLADKKPLSIGAGVVIATPSLPFHRLHQIAETLAKSAKRLDRQSSVVDWLVTTDSWADDPIGARRRQNVVRYGKDETARTLILNARPMRILNPSADKRRVTLKEMLADADKLLPPRSPRTEPATTAGGARSQLRALVEELKKGELQAELAFRRMPEDTKKALLAAGVDRVWEHGGGGLCLTRIADLVELAEISRLGRKPHLEGPTVVSAEEGTNR